MSFTKSKLFHFRCHASKYFSSWLLGYFDLILLKTESGSDYPFYRVFHTVRTLFCHKDICILFRFIGAFRLVNFGKLSLA
jgi:hypothetical protein